ncbi:MAG: hypothetical protein HC877_06450 [Thioploca sp.]|nr:hypothetical protein [Thioploca sp.]
MKNKLLYSLAGCLVLSSFLSSSVLACVQPDPPPKEEPHITEWICHDDGTVWVRIGPFYTFGTEGNPMVCACALTLAENIGKVEDVELVEEGTDTVIPGFIFTSNPNTQFGTQQQQGFATTRPISVEGGLKAELMFKVKLGSGQSCNRVKRIVGHKSTLFTGGATDDGVPSDHIRGWGPKLPVELINYSAVPSDTSITLNWLTGSEEDVLGYRVLRGKIQNVEVVSEGLIPNQGQGNTGASYSYEIPNVGNGVDAYILEVLNADGSSTYHINEESILVDGKKP